MPEEPDFIAFETIPDVEEVQAIIQLMMTKRYSRIPFWLSIQCRSDREMACGTPVEDIVPLLCNVQECFAFGVNCVSPEYVSSLVNIIRNQMLSLSLSTRIIAYPNSGEVYDISKREWIQKDASKLEHWVNCVVSCGADIVGGCCRTTPLHIQLLKNRIHSQCAR